MVGVKTPSSKKYKHMKRITVTVDLDDYAEKDCLARSRDVFASWVIRYSMRELLDREHSDALDPMVGSGNAR